MRRKDVGEMRCEEVVELLPDYSVDLVRGRRRADIERHLAQCSACAEEYRSLMDAVSLVCSLPRSEPARPLWPGTRARIEAQAVERPAMWAWRQHGARVLRPLTATVAVAAAAAAMWLYAPAPELPRVNYASAEAPYVRAHLQFASVDPLSGAAGTEPLIILAGRAEGRHTP